MTQQRAIKPYVAKIKIDKKAMARNRYNRIPLPSPDTVRERNTRDQDNIK